MEVKTCALIREKLFITFIWQKFYKENRLKKTFFQTFLFSLLLSLSLLLTNFIFFRTGTSGHVRLYDEYDLRMCSNCPRRKWRHRRESLPPSVCDTAPPWIRFCGDGAENVGGRFVPHEARHAARHRDDREREVDVWCPRLSARWRQNYRGESVRLGVGVALFLTDENSRPRHNEGGSCSPDVYTAVSRLNS